MNPSNTINDLREKVAALEQREQRYKELIRTVDDRLLVRDGHRPSINVSRDIVGDDAAKRSLWEVSTWL